MNVMAQLETELAYYNVAVQPVSHYATKTQPSDSCIKCNSLQISYMKLDHYWFKTSLSFTLISSTIIKSRRKLILYFLATLLINSRIAQHPVGNKLDTLENWPARRIPWSSPKSNLCVSYVLERTGYCLRLSQSCISVREGLRPHPIDLVSHSARGRGAM